MFIHEAHILVVDDVQAVRVWLKDLCRQIGFRLVSSASDGETAKEMLAQASYQAILCDYRMAPTDGVELLRYVRAKPELAALPFIMVTAESVKESVVLAIQSGVDDYLVKPLTAAQLEEKLLGLLMKKKVIG